MTFQIRNAAIAAVALAATLGFTLAATTAPSGDFQHR